MSSLVGGGCVDRLVTTYVLRAGGKKGGSAVERALNAGTLEMEDYTNFQYNARLVAGMHGFSYHPGAGRSHGDRPFPETQLYG